MATSTEQRRDLGTGRLLQHIRDAVIAVDADAGRIILWNPAAERLFGYSEAEALGLPVEALVPERLRARHRAGFARYGATGHGPFIDTATPRELPALRKTGEEITVQITLSPGEEDAGGRRFVLAIVRDLTEVDQATGAKELRAHARQQAVIASLGQRALAGADLAALTDEAAALVAQALGVEFCKVLELLPDGEALLLRSGVGWKEGYVGRALVGADIGSPAGYTLRSGEPVIVHDLRAETRFSGPPLLADHGVVSGLTVVIQGRDRPFGVLGADTTEPRTFTRDDVHFLQAVANVLATAIERTRAEGERERLLRRLGERVKELTLLHRLARLLHQVGTTPAGVLRAVAELLPAAYRHPDVAEARIEYAGEVHATPGFVPAPWRQEVAFATAGGRAGRVTVTYREARPAADEGPFLAEERATLDSAAELLRAYLERQEAEEERTQLIREQAAREQAEEAQRHAAFLAEASGQLAGSLDYEATLQRAARLAVPGLADWCTVLVVREDMSVAGLAVAHTDPAREEVARELLRRSPFRPRAAHGIAKVLRTGQPELYPEVPDALLVRRARDAGHLQALRSLGLSSAVIAPLVARGRTLGVLAFASAESGRRYGAAELALAEDLAGRVALALDNALLYEQQRAMVDRLQQLRGEIEAAERGRLLDSERRRIARELHDRVEQTFFSIALGADAALGTAADAPAAHLRGVLASVRSLASAGAEELREAIFALSRAEVREPGLLPMLWELVRDFQRRTGVEADLVLAGRERPAPREAVETLHAVAREALANVERHARAGAVVLSLRFGKRAATLTVQDDGTGVPPLILRTLDGSTTRFGLRSSRDRVQHLGGSFTVRPGHDGGTIVRARVPLGDRGPS